MALNIKDPKTERLAAQVAEMTFDTKTGAIRSALEDKLRFLNEQAARRARGDRVRRFLADEAWPQIPADILGTTVTKEQREEILGYGAEGV
jgi:antitoxin VapB